jgi:hypothetical protein
LTQFLLCVAGTLHRLLHLPLGIQRFTPFHLNFPSADARISPPAKERLSD